MIYSDLARADASKGYALLLHQPFVRDIVGRGESTVRDHHLSPRDVPFAAFADQHYVLGGRFFKRLGLWRQRAWIFFRRWLWTLPIWAICRFDGFISSPETAIGTGPLHAVRTFVPGDRIELTRNADYWDGHAEKLGHNVTCPPNRPIPVFARVAALLAGDC